jgi:hypothetical protein
VSYSLWLNFQLLHPLSTHSFESPADGGLAGSEAISPRRSNCSRAAHPWTLREILQRLALVGAGIFAALVIAEIVIRVAGLAPTSFYTYDRDCGWTTKADTVGWQTQEGRAYLRINHDGFRGPDYSFAKPADTLRVAVLGDSFTEAQQVAEQDTFCAVAQRRIQSAMPLEAADDGAGHAVQYKRVEVLNFGCDGYGTAQELITLRDKVWRYAPDVVVLAVFTGNDIRNNSVVLEGDKCRPFYVFDGPKLVLGGPFDDSFWFRTSCMLRFESRHFLVLNLLGDAKSLLRDRMRRVLAGKQPVAVRKGRSEPGLDDEIYRPPPNAVWREAWCVTDAEIEMVQRDVARHHARLLVVTLANGIQDDPDPVARQHYTHFVGAKDLFLPDDHIRGLGARDGFAVLNLAPPMQRYAEVHHMYLHGFPNTHPGIGHWNAQGHRVAGELIAQRLIEMLQNHQELSAPRPDAVISPPIQ